MGMRLEIRDQLFNARLAQATATGLKRAAIFYHARCRAAVNVPNTGTRVGGGRNARGQFLKQRTVYDNPSQPGEPPRKRTSHGQRGIIWEYNGDQRDPAVRIGVQQNAIYMAYLELGTRHIQPRPWLLATLHRHQAMIARLAATGGRGEIGR